jgi:Pro-kumamolisin, activation domain
MTANPVISGFVLYAEKSMSVGRHDVVSGGDLGVHAVAKADSGPQAEIADCVSIEPDHVVYSPSLVLGRDVRIGAMEANSIIDDGIAIGPLTLFPAAAMPPLPLAPPIGASGPDLTVNPGDVTALHPGSYGTLAVSGTAALNPGRYSFTKVTVGHGAKLLAIAGDVFISVAESLATGREVEIAPAFGQSAAHLTISFCAQDVKPIPTASLGERSRIRALVSVPHGTLALADHVHATGAFAAMDIALGEHVRVEFEDGLPVNAPGQKGGQQLSGYYGPHPNPSVAPLIGPVPANTPVALQIGLPMRDPAGLQTFIEQVSDPKNPKFRQYMTQAQFNSTHGATDADYAALKAWATAQGFTTYATYPNNLLLSVFGTAAQVEQALYVNLVYRVRQDGTSFIAVDREPSLDLAVSILEISGLTSFRVPQRAGATTGSAGGFQSSDLRAAYVGPSPELLALTGAGQVVGLLELDLYQQSDITAYDASQTPPLNPSNVTLVSIEAPPLGASGYSNNLEVALDIEMVQAMAPGAQVLVWETTVGITSHADDGLHAMATSTPPLTCASCSWSFGRSNNSQQALDQMAAQGVSFFLASGDYGNIGDPQGNQDMGSQILVGGTFLATNSVLTGLPSPTYPADYYAGETTWNQHPPLQGKGLTSGGIMDGNNLNGQCYCWPNPFCCGSGVQIPGYQVAIMQATAADNGGSNTWRNYPDVAMVAANLEIFYNGSPGTAWGTSAAAPLWAGFIALVNQLIKESDPSAGLAGFLNPTLYDIGLTRGTSVDLYAACFNDIADGVSNANGFPGFPFNPPAGVGFKSVPGYDLCTGLGSPKPALITQLGSPTPADAVFRVIRFIIGTGDADLRGNGGFGTGCKGSGCTADVFWPGGGMSTFTLKPIDTDDSWNNWTSTGPIDFPIPATDSSGNPVPVLNESQGIVGVRINQQQGNYSAPCGPNNWDIASLSVSLVAPTLVIKPLCQLNLVGTSQLQDGSTGLVRLSNTPGSSGNGPSSPIYTTGAGSGCP